MALLWVISLVACAASPGSPWLVASSARFDERRTLELQKRLTLVVDGTRANLDKVGATLQHWITMLPSKAKAKPTLRGTWVKASTSNLDEFLDRAMGVPWLKRRAALNGAQTQALAIDDSIGVVELRMTDLRGTKLYTMRPDGKTYVARGFMDLPCDQCVRWGSDGALVMTERYMVHLGGERHLQPCDDASERPLVRSWRGIDQRGMMAVRLERTLPSGEVLRMRTLYKRRLVASDAATPPL